MTKDEFLAKMKADEEWAPGWDAIEAEFSRLYPGQDPAHYGTLLPSRAMFGGDSYLDGFSAYRSEKGYYHIVTFGMSELYAEPDSFGKEWSRWGYEMTVKLAAPHPDDCKWAMDMLNNLARYTYKSERYFDPEQYVAGDGSPIKIGSDTKLTGLLIVSDTEAQMQETVYGKLQFLQLVGITQKEVQAIMDDRSNLRRILDAMRAENPDLVTDLSRTKSYI